MKTTNVRVAIGNALRITVTFLAPASIEARPTLCVRTPPTSTEAATPSKMLQLLLPQLQLQHQLQLLAPAPVPDSAPQVTFQEPPVYDFTASEPLHREGYMAATASSEDEDWYDSIDPALLALLSSRAYPKE